MSSYLKLMGKTNFSRLIIDVKDIHFNVGDHVIITDSDGKETKAVVQKEFPYVVLCKNEKGKMTAPCKTSFICGDIRITR